MIEEVVLPPLTEDNYYQDRHYMVHQMSLKAGSC